MPVPPLFIVGAHRSGTTMLRFMLNSGGRIYIPPESDFIPRFFSRHPHRPLAVEDVQRLLDVIFGRYRFASAWEGAPPVAAELMQALPQPTPAGFLDELYRRYAQQHDAVRWGDKTPIYANHVGLLIELFGDARIIHLIRDGRDVALSTLDTWADREVHVDIYYTARNWVRRVRGARTSGAALDPQQYLEVRYERLVEDPQAVLAAVCEFLDEPFAEAMAHPERLARQQIRPGTFHAPVRQAPSTTRVGRWRDEMSTADLHLFEHEAGSLLAELGYPLATTGDLLPTDRRRHAVLAGKYATLQAGRAVLQAVGLKPPI